MNKRIDELTELVESEGISLPYSIEDIIRLEDSGFVVDLETGAIVEEGSITYELTPGAEALAHIWALLDREPQR